MSELARKIAESRKVEIKIGHMTFYARRMTAVERAKVSAGVVSAYDAVVDFNLVTGWDGVTEKDLVPDSDSERQVKFDFVDFGLWVVDNLTILSAITEQITKKTVEFFDSKEENEKNSGAGTTKASGQKTS